MKETGTVHAEVRMPRPWTHLFEVEITVEAGGRDFLDFVMPVWTPGSYMVREFARNVQDFSASGTGAGPLPWEKVRKNVWRVNAGPGPAVMVRYSVLASEAGVRTSFLDDSRAFISASSLIFYVEGLLKASYRLRIHPVPGWNRISTGLDAAPGDDFSFVAPDYDTLVDCPIEIGNQDVFEFSAGGVPHRVSVTGRGNHNREILRRDLQKIVEKAAEIMGDMPYRHYTFLINLVSEGHGGLEHSNSTALQVSRWTFRPAENYRKFLSLASHEFFHLWNVKRLRPAELGPFDYTAENHTRLLWIVEGFTDYYGDHILRRAGLVTADQYLQELSRTIQGYMETPGRLVQPVAQASFDAWIKFYRQDEHSPNNSISYYVKGHLLALVLDLEIRHRTTTRTLDDVMRLLYEQYSKGLGRGFTEREFRDACESAAGGGLGEILDEYVHGTREMDFNRYLAHAGLTLAGRKGAAGPPKPYLGISLKSIDGHSIVTAVTAGGPAYEQGINAGDEMLAMDGFRVSTDSIAARIEEKSPGDSLELLVSRGGLIRTLHVTLAEKDELDFTIVRVREPDPAQKLLFESWLKAPWERGPEKE